MKITEAVKVVNGLLKNSNCDLEVSLNDISTDSRQMKPGQIFIPLVGVDYDGHDFIEEAFKKGASIAFVNEKWWGKNHKCPLRIIVVRDTLKALQALAQYHRCNFEIPVIAVTGSNGKTTTKDMIAAILKQKLDVVKSHASYNNEIGLPLTLLQITNKTQAVVVEMGMRGMNQIEELATISQPTIGVITNIAPVHLELLGTIENIVQAKGELVRKISKSGKVLLNGEDNRCREMASWSEATSLFYGFNTENKFRAENIETSFESSTYLLRICEEEIEISLPIPGLHNILNSLAAAGVAFELGFNLKDIQKGLKDCSLSEMRLEISENSKGVVIINDAYNANPVSMMASIDVLASALGKRKIAILGAMHELGEFEKEGHLLVGEHIYRSNIDILVAVGEKAALIALGAKRAGMGDEKIFLFDKKINAAMFLKEYIVEGDCVLLKASRAAKLDEIVEKISGER